MQIKPSVLFKLTAPDKLLRRLMHFIQQEGIITQNTISELIQPNVRNFWLWVDAADQEKIQDWLREQEFAGIE